MVSIRRRKVFVSAGASLNSFPASQPASERSESPCVPGKSVYIRAAKLKKEGVLQAGNGALRSAAAAAFHVSSSAEVVKKKSQRRKQNQHLSSLRGVYFKNRKWQAAIKVGKKQVHLGTYSTKEDAAHIYDRAAYLCGREPNFPLSRVVKQELDSLSSWDEFLVVMREENASKKMQTRLETRRSVQANGGICKLSSSPPLDDINAGVVDMPVESSEANCT